MSDEGVDRADRADLVMRGGQVLVGDRFESRSVAVTDGRVVSVGPLDATIDAGEEVVLAADEVLIPGLVDTHVHVNEPGRTEWEGFETATRAAAAGGVTTILDMPLNSIPATLDAESLRVKQQAAAGQCHVDVGFWGGAVPANLGQLRTLYEAGVFGFKCFLLDSGVPEFPPLLGDQLDQAMAEIADFDGLLIVHAEDGAVIEAAPPPAGADYARFLGSRPKQSENVAIDHVINAARQTGCRAHIVHLSSAEAVPRLSAARADGVRITVETCPHYLTLDAESVPAGQTQYKCCPPVRESGNRDALWTALAEGVIDVVVSDHSPSTIDLKCLDTGDFGTAWGGVSSLQLGLPLVWTEAARRGHDLTEVLRWMSSGTSGLVGLPERGRIAEGSPADLVVLAPDETFVVDPATLYHRNAISPYAGLELRGVVRRTYLRGRQVTGQQPRGALIEREGT